MFASSLCMYSLEHEAQPDVFSNAFSGIWWAGSTLLTVGIRGHLSHHHPWGNCSASSSPSWAWASWRSRPVIISAGFVDQYSRIKRMSEYGPRGGHPFHPDPASPSRTPGSGRPSPAPSAHPRHCGRHPAGPPHPRPPWQHDPQDGDSMVLGAESFHNQ